MSEFNQTQILPDEHIEAFIATLDDTGRRVVAYFIDGEITAAGFPSTRPGSKVYAAAEKLALSSIISKELDLSELAPDILASLDAEGENDTERTVQRETRKRVDSIARYLEQA